MVRTKVIHGKYTTLKDKELADLKKCLDYLGYEEDTHYYIQKLYRVTYYLEARAQAILTEEEKEDFREYPPHSNYEIEDCLHTEEDVIGHFVTNTDNKPVDVFEIYRMAGKSNLCANRCVICGCTVIAGNRDKRREKDGLKCFDHVGIKSKIIDDEIQEKIPPPLPIMGEKTKVELPQNNIVPITSFTEALNC